MVPSPERFDVRASSQCSLASAMLWCDRDWWLWQQAVGQVVDPSGKHLDWRHARTGTYLTWVSVFVRTLGDR